ncbi:mitochondrial distribution and morphology protein 31 [Acrodontium crateriforme]|uniref:Mitochondrial distribution and morphology protein 31 n=1 Tax=Acrodontium crateriforme TaxID=150365 RepID=A0AAQ3RC76_9PEZI|nr:mitochondrial distribution and morphology protein 31 [Acrodontium crateriforme]
MIPNALVSVARRAPPTLHLTFLAASPVSSHPASTTPVLRGVRLFSGASGLINHVRTAHASIDRTITPVLIGERRSSLREIRYDTKFAPRIQNATAGTWQVQRRLKSDDMRSKVEAPSKESADVSHRAPDVQAASKPASEPLSAASPAAAAGGSSKYLLDRLPHLHRPTKAELLSAATGFWHRLSIRFKWFSIRSVRPFNIDDIGAFLSWIFWGHVLWIVIGTTTFVSLAIWAVNTVFAQETVAGWVGNYLTRSSGIKVVFESAIVPTWRNGVITFNNVFVSRRPGQHSKRERAVSKGSSTTAAAAAAAAGAGSKNKDSATPDDDGNYSQFDVTIDTVNVTLSFTKWFNGKGLLHDVEVRGVRGVIDRTWVRPTGEIRDPKSYRHEHATGDFEIDNFKMEDVLLTIYQPNDFRPFTVSVFNCELPRLRKQWLFYDFMSANNMSGSFDDSLFTIHPRQVHGTTGAVLSANGMDQEDPGRWKKHTRLRIDALKIDHLNRGVDGPFSWIHEGNVDVIADVMIPTDADGSIAKVMSDFYDRMEATVINAHHRESNMMDSTPGTETSTSHKHSDDDPPLILDIRIHLNDVRASVPIFTKDLSYVNNALVRPIVAYINSRRAFIPVSCRVVKSQSEFDGSWTIFDSGLLDDLSRETYDAFANDIADSGQTRRRIKKVATWGLQVAAQALFIGLAGQLA